VTEPTTLTYARVRASLKKRGRPISARFTMPVSVLLLLTYVLGMLTGGFVLALVRTWVRGARGV
jgi:hypothetical protein